MVRDRAFYKTMFSIALPSAFQSFIGFLVVVADDMMVSSMSDGVFAQAAVSQINNITAFYTAVILGLASGSAVLISQYWGKRDLVRIKKIFSVVMLLSVLVSLIFTLAALLLPSPLLRLVIDPAETQVSALARDYFLLVCFSYLPYAVTYALIGMLRAVEVVKVTLIITIASLFVNIGMNYVLIFGRLGFPALGVKGAAIATVISRVVELVIVAFYTFRVQKVLPIRPKHFLHVEGWAFRDYIRFGLPVALGDTQWALIGMLKAAIIGQMGATFIAANSIVSSLMNLGTLFTFALASSACVVVGKAVGSGRNDLVRQYSNTIQVMFLIIGVGMATLVFLMRAPFIGLYGSAEDPQVRSLSLQMAALGAFTLIGTSYHASCFVGINRGAGDSRFVMLVDMICGWGIVLPATLLAAFVLKLPLPLVFLATRIDQCFKWIIAFIRLRGNRWIRNVTRSSAAPE